MVRIFSSSLAALALLASLASAGLLVPENLSVQQLTNLESELSPASIPGVQHIGTPAQHPGNLLSPAKELHIGTTAPPNAPRLERRRRRDHSKSASHIPHGKVTFYGGSQLLNPACPGFKNPTDGSMIAAISFDSPFKCGDKIKISDPQGKHVIVTAIDRCAGCTRDWIDVTKGVFQLFSGLDTGVLRDVSFTKM